VCVVRTCSLLSVSVLSVVKDSKIRSDPIVELNSYVPVNTNIQEKLMEEDGIVRYGVMTDVPGNIS
jgi:hypothetical protein